MDQIPLIAVATCWATVAIVWLLGGIYGLGFNSANRPRPSIRGAVSGPRTLGVFALSVVVFVVGRVVLGPISIGAPWSRLLGVVLLLSATGFALWARRGLGTSWSVGPKVTGDGRLRTDGAYAVTRHPIYTGLLGMIVGTALATGGGQELAVVGVGVVIVLAKIRMEEQLLLAAFPDEYPGYRARVPMLVPGLRLLQGR